MVARRVRVLVEVPRFGFVKREAGGAVDFVTPFPCPFNYGCIPGTLAPDGDPADALVLGPGVKAGIELEVEARGIVRFEDGGVRDDKLVCSARSLDRWDLVEVRVFFTVYARARRVLDRSRGRAATTRYLGVDVFGPG